MFALSWVGGPYYWDEKVAQIPMVSDGSLLGREGMMDGGVLVDGSEKSADELFRLLEIP